MSCTCFIVPQDVLEKLANDSNLSEELRRASHNTAQISVEIRESRNQAAKLTSAESVVGTQFALAVSPMVTVYDCKQIQRLPGAPVPNPGNSADSTANRTFKETTSVADFYQKVFSRNSIDNAGMTMMSSIHYGVNFNNAMWTGSQMLYGDGDAAISVADDGSINRHCVAGITPPRGRLAARATPPIAIAPAAANPPGPPCDLVFGPLRV